MTYDSPNYIVGLHLVEKLSRIKRSSSERRRMSRRRGISERKSAPSKKKFTEDSAEVLSIKVDSNLSFFTITTYILTHYSSKMNKNNVQPSQSIPLFRRKRSYLFILLSLLLLALYLRIPSSSAPFSNNPQRQTKNLIHAKGPLRKPTAALEKLALQQGVLRPIDPNGKDLTQDKENNQFISTSENLYLLFGALKKKDWNLNEGDYGIIQPKDQKEMVKALGKLGLDKKLVSYSSDRQETCFECTTG